MIGIDRNKNFQYFYFRQVEEQTDIPPPYTLLPEKAWLEGGGGTLLCGMDWACLSLPISAPPYTTYLTHALLAPTLPLHYHPAPFPLPPHSPFPTPTTFFPLMHMYATLKMSCDGRWVNCHFTCLYLYCRSGLTGWADIDDGDGDGDGGDSPPHHHHPALPSPLTSLSYHTFPTYHHPPHPPCHLLLHLPHYHHPTLPTYTFFPSLPCISLALYMHLLPCYFPCLMHL